MDMGFVILIVIASIVVAVFICACVTLVFMKNRYITPNDVAKAGSSII